MGTNSYIYISSSKLSAENTTSTYFLLENKDWDIIFLWYGSWIHLQKEAEMCKRESKFLQWYGIEWDACDQEETY